MQGVHLGRYQLPILNFESSTFPTSQHTGCGSLHTVMWEGVFRSVRRLIPLAVVRQDRRANLSFTRRHKGRIPGRMVRFLQ